MKKPFIVVMVLLCTVTLCLMSCRSSGDLDFGNASITVSNESDYDVTDLIVLWSGIEGTGLDFPRLAELKKDESRIFPVVFSVPQAYSRRAGSMYTLNGRRFTNKDEANVIVDKNGAVFPSREIAEGSKLFIHINNENYTLSGGVPRPELVK